MTSLRKILEELVINNDAYISEHDRKKSIDFAHQQILALIPKKKGCKEGEQYWMWQSVHNVYDYGKMMGKNQAISEMEQSMTGER